MSDTLVSVGMPVYNCPESMKLSIDSILAQTYKNLEIIISNNASPNPEIYKILDDYAAKDCRIRLFHQPVDLTVYGNYPFVLKQATGKYFIYAQDDDCWSPDYVEKLVMALERNQEAVVAVGDPAFINSKGDIIKHIDMSQVSLFTILGSSKAGFIFMGLWITEYFRKFEFISTSVLGGDHIVAAEALLSNRYAIDDSAKYYKGLKSNALQQYFKSDRLYRFHIYYQFVKRLITSKYIPTRKKLFVVPIIACTNLIWVFCLYAMQAVLMLPADNFIRQISYKIWRNNV